MLEDQNEHTLKGAAEVVQLTKGEISFSPVEHCQVRRFEFEYEQNCAYGNLYCVCGLYGNPSYRCWDKGNHKPFDVSDPDWEHAMKDISWTGASGFQHT